VINEARQFLVRTRAKVDRRRSSDLFDTMFNASRQYPTLVDLEKSLDLVEALVFALDGLPIPDEYAMVDPDVSDTEHGKGDPVPD
jgi:hypothetical protein